MRQSKEGVGPVQHSAAADTEFLGQLLRLLYQQAFLPAALAAEQADLLAADRKGVGQKAHQRVVGLAVDGRCADADLQPFAMLAGKLGALGAGLQMAVEDQILALPVVERHWRQSASVRPRGMLAAAARLAMTSMSNSRMAIKAKIGDRSSPPSAGRILRIGASSGSHNWLISVTAGL